MDEAGRRTILYGASGAVLATLLWAGFVREVPADVGTLLGAANVQLRLAHGMPATDREGRPVPAREQLLDEAGRNLELAATQAPDSAVVAEFQGFLQSLRGDPRGAAAHYRRARGLPDCTDDQRATLVFNEARMLDAAGEPAAALAVFEQEARSLPAELATQRHVEEAGMLGRLGRLEPARARLQQVAEADDPVAWLQAGLVFEQLGDRDRAEQILGRAAEAVPIADYHRSRLKLATGDVDSCLRLLARAAEAVPTEVRRAVREDSEAWRVLAGDARFRQLTASGAAAPGR